METRTLTCDFCGTQISSGRYATNKNFHATLRTKHDKTTIKTSVFKINFGGAEFHADICDKCLAELLNEAAELLQESTTTNERHL